MAALYVVATPIGNLQDFSPRAAETMKGADLIIAEDTRVTMKLCQVFGFRAPLVSCHRHNEGSKAETLASKILEENLNAALVTDAGTPCISDPGNEVVRACIGKGIPVIPVPGCSAGIAALSVSGTDAREFAFYGFLPREKKALKEKLREIAAGVPVAVIHESPFRIYGTPEEVLNALKANEKTEKGEYCVVLDLHAVPKPETEKQAPSLSAEAKLIEAMKQGMTLREAQVTLIATGEKKNTVKQAAITLKRILDRAE